MAPNRIKNTHIVYSLITASFFWYITFYVKLLNFWLSMSIAAMTLGLLAVLWGGLPFRVKEVSWRALLIGIASAALLYFIFWCGNIISRSIFNFAGPQITSIYNIRTQGETYLVALILIFITSPGEELFWRNFLQKWAMKRWGLLPGWILSSLIYGGVHVFSGNFMLVMAALIAGFFWGLIYCVEKSAVPLMISHALWTSAIFVFYPLM